MEISSKTIAGKSEITSLSIKFSKEELEVLQGKYTDADAIGEIVRSALNLK